MKLSSVSAVPARDIVAMARRQAAERAALAKSLKELLPREQFVPLEHMLAAITNEIEKEVVAPLVAAHPEL